jgi:hypothetical protein
MKTFLKCPVCGIHCLGKDCFKDHAKRTGHKGKALTFTNKDTSRINWIIKNEREISCDISGTVEKWLVIGGLRKRTLRQAIDSAMDNEDN